MSAPLAVLFSLVLRLQLTQQCPGENDGQEETHENSKADKNRSHEKLKIIPASPSTSTTAPIIDATNPTYFCSKSCAITNQPHSNSVSKTSIDESPPNQTPKTVRPGRPIRDPGPLYPSNARPGNAREDAANRLFRAAGVRTGGARIADGKKCGGA